VSMTHGHSEAPERSRNMRRSLRQVNGCGPTQHILQKGGPYHHLKSLQGVS
jgi:hypothetical protein